MRMPMGRTGAPEVEHREEYQLAAQHDANDGRSYLLGEARLIFEKCLSSR